MPRLKNFPEFGMMVKRCKLFAETPCIGRSNVFAPTIFRILETCKVWFEKHLTRKKNKISKGKDLVRKLSTINKY